MGINCLVDEASQEDDVGLGQRGERKEKEAPRSDGGKTMRGRLRYSSKDNAAAVHSQDVGRHGREMGAILVRGRPMRAGRHCNYRRESAEAVDARGKVSM